MTRSTATRAIGSGAQNQRSTAAVIVASPR